MTPIEDERAEFSTLGSTQKYSLSDLGILSHAGSNAHAINDRGDVIGVLGVGESDEFSPQANHSFLWRNGEIVDFGRSMAVTGINDSGQMVGIEYPPDFDLNMTLEVSPIFCGDSEWQSILPTRANFGVPAALNNAGQVVGQLCSRQSQKQKKSFRPALWSDSAAQMLKIPSFYNSGVVKGLNDAGQAVGFLQKVTAQPAYRTVAVLWDGDAVTTLGSLPGSEQSDAVAINNRGCVICVTTFGSDQFGAYARQLMAGDKPIKEPVLSFNGFVWDKGMLTALITPSDTVPGIDVSKGCLPRALNEENVVVGRATDIQGHNVAFVWQNHQMADLNTLVPSREGWTLTEARDINNKGQIVGAGKYKGRSHAFQLTPL